MSLVDLSYDEVETLINEISSGGKIRLIKDSAGNEVPLFICYCSLYDKLNANLEYKKAYALALADGFYTAEQAKLEMRRRGFFTEDDEAKLEKLFSQREAQDKVLQKTTKIPVRRERLIGIIENIDKRISVLVEKRERGLEFSAERRAQETKYLYMTWRGVKCPYTKERYWVTKEEFDQETDIDLRTNALVQTVKLSLGMDVSVLRFLARNNLWRIRYNTSVKTGVSLFGADLTEYSIDQLALAHWSNYYQSIYDMMPSDRPPDSIIEDDSSLDAYMKSYMEEQERDASDARMKKKGGVGTTAWDHGDVLVMRSNPHYEDIEEFADTSKFLDNSSTTDVKERDKESSRKRKSIRTERNNLRKHLK